MQIPALDRGVLAASGSGRFTAEKINNGTLRMTGWVRLRANLDTVMRKISVLAGNRTSIL
jgi:hypothetical protein